MTLGYVNALLMVALAGMILLSWRIRRLLQREAGARLHAERMIRRHGIMFNTIADAVIIMNGETIIKDANTAATDMLGYTREELIGQRPEFWQDPEESARRYPRVMAELAERGEWVGEYTARRKDGTRRPVESRVRSISDADGRVIQIIAILRDRSEQRRLELQLLRAQKLDAIGSLGAGIAHEINTPLQYVADNMQFLDDGLHSLRSVIREGELLAAAVRADPALAPAVTAFDEAVREIDLDYLDMQLPDAANHAREGCARVREIVRALTRFAKPLSAGKSLTDLNASIRDALTVCRNEWKTVANVTTDLDATLPLVPSDSVEINQVLLNLIVNAAQALAASRGAAAPMGRIAISSRHDGDWVEIRVADDGPGISAENQSRVFDPFFTTREPGMGVGHGLSLAHVSIVDNHGGRLSLESAEGEGATFVIQLPKRSHEAQPEVA